MAYPYTPAFVAFLQGAPLDEISTEFKIPLASLKAKMRQEAWRTLANRLNGRLAVELSPHSEILQKIEANRAQNYERAVKLGEHLDTILEHLKAGTLRVKKTSNNKGQITQYDAEPTPADLVSIAIYAKSIADMAYRALGDLDGKGRRSPDAAALAQAPSLPISIVLPTVIAKPRAEREGPGEDRLLEDKP